MPLFCYIRQTLCPTFRGKQPLVEYSFRVSIIPKRGRLARNGIGDFTLFGRS